MMTLLFVLHFVFLLTLAGAVGWLVYLARVHDHE
jgi:hypothetical protein